MKAKTKTAALYTAISAAVSLLFTSTYACNSAPQQTTIPAQPTEQIQVIRGQVEKHWMVGEVDSVEILDETGATWVVERYYSPVGSEVFLIVDLHHTRSVYDDEILAVTPALKQSEIISQENGLPAKLPALDAGGNAYAQAL